MSEFVFTGNEIELYLDGVLADLVQNVNGNDDYAPEPASGLGNIHAREYVPTFARHQIAIEKMVFRREALVTRGIILENGDDAMRGRYFTIEIFQKGGPLLRAWDRASNASGRVAGTAHRIMVMDAQFVATDARGALVGS